MTALAFFVLALNLTGLWSAQQSYPAGQGTTREGQFIQPAGGTFDYRWVMPVADAPLEDVINLQLYVERQGDGTLSGFIRNPESNLGAAIGTRTVVASGTSIALQAKDKPAIIGRYEGAADTLTFHFEQAPGDFVFHRTVQWTPRPYIYHAPAQRADGWHTGSLKDAGIDSHKIAAIIERVMLPPATSLRAPFIQGFLIARHGKLVLDEYFNGFDVERPHDVRSAGKSITTLLVGTAIAEDGSSRFNPESRVYELLAGAGSQANLDPRKLRMTVADLMSMRSGYACDDNDDNSPGNEDAMQSQTRRPDWYAYTLTLPMESDPGTKAVYCTAGINLLGDIVARSTKQWLPSYFAARFATPMQFGRYALWLMPPPTDEAYMGGGDVFRPRDFLKFGQLFLDDGRWNGVQIIDPAWLRAVAEKRATIEGEIGDYGWGWHLYEFDVGGRKIKAISAGGNGGQLLFAFPQLDMTLMITAANYGQYPVWSAYITKVVPEVLAAVKP